MNFETATAKACAMDICADSIPKLAALAERLKLSDEQTQELFVTVCGIINHTIARTVAMSIDVLEDGER